jgi:hypothetical protein
LGEEDKAIQIYIHDKNGNPLEELINPSEPFKGKLSDTTPLHLASVECLEKLIAVFLLHGGNPNHLNGRQETCLHSVCSRSDVPEKRLKLLETFMDWRRLESDGVTEEAVSINRTDIDGNAAIHRAAASGLDLCVARLVRAGAILSLVNQAQRTCCELADAATHVALATALELALVYQPDDDYSMFRQENQAALERVPRPTTALLTVDTLSLSSSGVLKFVEEIVEEVSAFLRVAQGHRLYVAPSRVETMLRLTGWDPQALYDQVNRDADGFYSRCFLTPSAVCSYIYETAHEGSPVDSLSTKAITLGMILFF